MPVSKYDFRNPKTGKQARIHQLKSLNLEQLVRTIFIGVAYCAQPVLFTSISAQIANRLRFNDKAEGIQTAAELLAVLCLTDAFDIIKVDRSSSLMLQSRIPLSDELVSLIEYSEYLPPMVCQPQKVTHNFESGYLTHNDSLILGRGNNHDGNICLDVLNLCNRVRLRLDTDFLGRVEEEPTFALDTMDKSHQWGVFKSKSYHFYSLMVEQGNSFYLTHKVDKRGRIYAQGYHITTQGTPFKKAALELADPQPVTGVPQ